jgi:hypothetical protein
LPDKGVDLIEFERVDRLLLALFGRRRRGQSGCGGINPIDNGLVVDADQPRDASEVDAIDVHAQGHLSFFGFVAFVFWFWGVGASAVLTMSSGAAAVIGAGFGLSIRGLAGRAGQNRSVRNIHKKHYDIYSPQIDTPPKD